MHRGRWDPRIESNPVRSRSAAFATYSADLFSWIDVCCFSRDFPIRDARSVRVVAMRPTRDALEPIELARHSGRTWPISRWTLVWLAFLFVLQVAALSGCSAPSVRTALSGVIQLTLSVTCTIASVRAIGRSEGPGRYCWRWMTVSFLIWTIAQFINLKVILQYDETWDRIASLLFFLSVIPFAMLLLTDAEEPATRFDPIQLLDFLQVFLNWLAVYLLFTPRALENSGSDSLTWIRDVVYNGTLALTLLIRALGVKKERYFFCAIALFIILSGAADAYADHPAIEIAPGTRFDLVWSVLLVIPILLAAHWGRARDRQPGCLNKTSCIASHAFPLVYPFATSLLVALIAPHSPFLACTLIAVTFVAIAVRMLVIQRRLLEVRQRLQFEATHDPLTGVWNHGAALDLLELEIKRSLRSGSPVGVLMIDLDHFKRINDRYGHQVGDQVLKGVVARTTAELRDYDIMGRYGGEEFIIMLPQCNPREVLACAERLRRAIAGSPIETITGPVNITASFGASCSPAPDMDSRSVVGEADAALYRAKQKGRNCVEGNFGTPLPPQFHPLPHLSPLLSNQTSL